jgi:hypothetical protein
MGGVLSQLGYIYGIPCCSDKVLRINPATDETTLLGSSLLSTGGYKWTNGVLSPAGIIFGVPGGSNSDIILRIDPETDTISLVKFDFGTDYKSDALWGGGVVSNSGTIYGIPSSSEKILRIGEPSCVKTCPSGTHLLEQSAGDSSSDVCAIGRRSDNGGNGGSNVAVAVGGSLAALLILLIIVGICLHRRASSPLKAAGIRRKTDAGDRDSVHSNPAYEANPMISEIQATSNPMSSGDGASAEQIKQEGRPTANLTANDAEFDPVGQFPVNDAAKALFAQQWLSQSKSSGKEPLLAVDYADIAEATDNFDKRHEIGGGASCTVYKAGLFGVSCAIKVLEEPEVADAAHAWEVRQFIAEMVLLGRVRHPNVCRLYAVSTNSTNKCLVLELMEASLDARLGWYAKAREAEQKAAGQQVSKPQPRLSWQQRLSIAICSCRGIAHLHQQKPAVVHRDVKSQNVLICGFETPQADLKAARVTLADFGTARKEQSRKGSMDATLTVEATGMVVGTGPYMPTECECAFVCCGVFA